MDKLLEIKKETGVAVARQIEFAIDYFLERYEREPGVWMRDLVAYVKGPESGHKGNK